MELLSQTLAELGVAGTLIDEVKLVCESVRDSVLCKGAIEEREEN